MSKRREWFGCLTIILMTVAGVGGARWCWLEQYWTPEKIDDAIRIALPLGSGRVEVEAWLDTQHIRHVQLCRTDGTPLQVVFAEIWDVPRRFDWSGDIEISFHFDEKDRLLWYTVEWFPVSL
jgi:hypothetical protein